MMKTKRVTEKQAIEVINEIKGSPIMSITQRTYPKLLKKDRLTGLPAKYLQDQISKVTETTIKVGSEYVTRVLNQLKRENKDSKEYVKGTNTNALTKLAKNGILGINKYNKLQFEYTTLPNVKPIVNYLFDNGIIEKSKIGDILPKRYEAKNQGTDVEIQIRKVNFSNILDFTVNGTKYLITR